VCNKWKPRKNDVIICAYPKTGTNWLQEITRQIIYLKDPELLQKTKAFSHFYSLLAYGPASKYEITDKLEIPRRIFGTNLPSQCLNLEKFKRIGTKLIHVIRNPKDQAVSWYYFAQHHPFIAAGVQPFDQHCPKDVEKFIDNCIEGLENEGYLHHVRGWYDHKGDPNILFISFEDLKRDLPKEIRKIAKFIDVQISDSDVNDIVANTAINKMPQTEKTNNDISKSMIRKGNNIGNMSSLGIVGDWKTHFTDEQSNRLDAKVREVLSNTDIQFTYEL
uniref:Sulfotransferase n=1 Tax=Ciona intestinalis TaxID=7719 RepID=H2XPA6_CIOIN